MTVKELRTLVNNLDEYIHVPGGIERLKKTILHLAISGQLVPQDSSEGTGEELYQCIQTERKKFSASGELKKQKPLPPIVEDEIPYAIPKSWKWVRLGESCELKSGNQYSYTLDGEKGIPYVKVGDMNLEHNSEVITMSSQYYVCSEVNDNDMIIANSIIFPKRGGAIATNKKRVVARPILIDSNTMAVKPTGLFHFRYFQTWFSGVDISKFGDYSAVPQVNNKDLIPLLVPLPPLAEQKRIVAKVSSVFILIDQLTTIYMAEQAERNRLVGSSLAQLARGESILALKHLAEIIHTKADTAQLRKAILHLAVTGQLVPQDSLEGTGEELYWQIQTEKSKLIVEGKLKKQKSLPQITESETQFNIPANWKWARLGDISIYQQRGKSPKYADKSQFPVISQRCVRTGHIDWTTVKYIISESVKTYEEFRFLRDGDLLLNSTGTGTMGRVGVFTVNPQYKEVVADSHVTVVRFSELVSFKFAHICFNAPFIQDDIESKASGSTNQIEWNLSSIQEELMPLPPLAEQARIVQKTTELLNLVTELENVLKNK